MSPPVSNAISFDDLWIGMPVHDAAGSPIGAVVYLQPAGSARSAPGEPRVDPDHATSLARSGFVKVRGFGLMDHDRYLPVDQIAAVDEDTVVLAGSTESLVPERQWWS